MEKSGDLEDRSDAELESIVAALQNERAELLRRNDRARQRTDRGGDAERQTLWALLCDVDARLQSARWTLDRRWVTRASTDDVIRRLVPPPHWWLDSDPECPMWLAAARVRQWLSQRLPDRWWGGSDPTPVFPLTEWPFAEEGPEPGALLVPWLYPRRADPARVAEAADAWDGVLRELARIAGVDMTGKHVMVLTRCDDHLAPDLVWNPDGHCAVWRWELDPAPLMSGPWSDCVAYIAERWHLDDALPAPGA